MTKYIENPKMKGSSLLACIPQKGECPLGCDECFYNRIESYLQPLNENTPNMPSIPESIGRIIRVNDGHDSSVNIELVLKQTEDYADKFYNTSILGRLEDFKDPVVLTINPGKMTDKSFYVLDPIPKNLMFVRIRVNCWNIEKVVKPAVEYYTSRKVPVVLTFLAYYETPIPSGYEDDYVFRKRTTNEYWAITTDAWEEIMRMFKYNIFVYSCGKIEGEKGKTSCARCGNCIREFFVTQERLRTNGERI